MLVTEHLHCYFAFCVQVVHWRQETVRSNIYKHNGLHPQFFPITPSTGDGLIDPHQESDAFLESPWIKLASLALGLEYLPHIASLAASLRWGEATLLLGGANAPLKNEKIVVIFKFSPHLHPYDSTLCTSQVHSLQFALVLPLNIRNK